MLKHRTNKNLSITKMPHMHVWPAGHFQGVPVVYISCIFRQGLNLDRNLRKITKQCFTSFLLTDEKISQLSHEFHLFGF